MPGHCNHAASVHAILARKSDPTSFGFAAVTAAAAAADTAAAAVAASQQAAGLIADKHILAAAANRNLGLYCAHKFQDLTGRDCDSDCRLVQLPNGVVAGYWWLYPICPMA